MAKRVVVKASNVVRAPPPPPAPGNSASGASKRKGPPLETEFEGEEHRQFPRARMSVRFNAWIDKDGERMFSASFTSVNLSVSGAFLESTFFLPVGTEIRVSFQLEESPEPVEARASILRAETPDERHGKGRSGLAIRFVQFYGQTEVTLARLFLGDQLRSFSETYLGSKRARSLSNELDRVVDALAAWELLKVTQPGDPWRPA